MNDSSDSYMTHTESPTFASSGSIPIKSLGGQQSDGVTFVDLVLAPHTSPALKHPLRDSEGRYIEKSPPQATERETYPGWPVLYETIDGAEAIFLMLLFLSSEVWGSTDTMSLKPAHIVQNPYFYPVGNTPAVCLTDTLPPEVDGKVLLLGCGDVRNILCTVYNGAGSVHDRKLDFTCCDIEAEIIARNTVILTLIADDKEGAHFKHAWNIYYHVFLDTESMSVLRAHVKSLLHYAQSLEGWRQSPYASLIHFCDEGTLKAVVELWKLYATDPSSEQAYADVQARLKDQWKAAQRHRDEKVANSPVLDSLRSAAPVLFEACTDVDELYRTFWKTGTCLDDKKFSSKSNIANPMFGCLRSRFVLHYGQSPLTAFHLAPAYTQLAKDSPLVSEIAKSHWPTGSKALQAAFEQFVAGSITFRKHASQITVRFVNADAIAYCYVLQSQQVNVKTEDSQWYRHYWSFERLILSKTEYASPDSAPVLFNVIDTSNLIDHLGTLNLLAATAPLLEHTPASTLRTEMMVPREVNVAESAKKLLCGDLPAMAALLGLKPIQYWANTTTTCNVNENMLQDIPGANEISGCGRHPIILWKPINLSAVRYDAVELARFIYSIYLEMHSDESWATRFTRNLQAYDLYTRAGLAALLKCIKNTHVVNWPQFIHKLVADLIVNDQTLNMGPHHFQSLLTHLEMFSVMRLDEISDGWRSSSIASELQGPFRGWIDVPPVVCITLVVPHQAVAMFSDINKGNGSPICQMQLHSSVSNSQALYPDIQLGFGTVRTSGKAFTNQYRITVTPDTEGWKGDSPLIVTAMVSTVSLVGYGDTAARVAFALKSTTSNEAKFLPKLGVFLHLHRSAVGQDDVFITQHRPNTTGHMSVGSAVLLQPSSDKIASVTATPFLATHITSVQVRCDIVSEEAKQLMQSAAHVSVEQSGLFELKLKIGSTLYQRIEVPFPLKVAASKTRISRKQLWIEFTAPIADLRSLAMRPDTVFPVDMQGARAYNELTIPGRLKVKDCLYNMYMQSVGLFGARESSFFCLESSTVTCNILIDSVRMDLSHGTVFLDAAFLPPQPDTGCTYIFSFTDVPVGNINVIPIGKDTMICWKHLLAASAERCRQWKHKKTCEYQAAGRMPISTDGNQPVVCSCGAGKFPDKYLEKSALFKHVAKFAVRVAIPVIFASPISRDEEGPVKVKPASARSPSTHAGTQGTQPKKEGCLKCGAATTKAGNSLLKCAKCKAAQYCSPDCQKKDWKKHKQICKQVQEKGVGDDAA
ncbi:hypothetical protein OPT61_g9112 [Boeremia exigua]|uniref:Uncharacterized protein n=1 Tax=Boeremia exigua TaxID=749465 RepID=A0ACC2HVP9_9PLEO|nr:hypothetical protein OPT61_g9112 [Boeremia exigua]